MVNQGILGAIEQYWTVEDKPRLHRRNTFFDEQLQVSNTNAVKLGIVAIVVSVGMIVASMIGGIL